MGDTVYLLGAGVNQVITDRGGLKPPLSNNFFQMALHSPEFADNSYNQDRIRPLLDFISQIWKKNKDDLLNELFNLEDCFTMLELKREEALGKKDNDEYLRLAKIQLLLVSFLANYLDKFKFEAIDSDTMKRFGNVIYKEKPTVITLNYDIMLEMGIEYASGVNSNMSKLAKSVFLWYEKENQQEIPDDLLPYSHSNWNKSLAYGVKFDEVEIRWPGPIQVTEGSRFYGHSGNKLYPWRILKLHGSLNWFRYLSFIYPPLIKPEDKELFEKKKGKMILLNSARWWHVLPEIFRQWWSLLPEFDNWLLEPLIITPVLYKKRFYQVPPFPDIWRQAHGALSTCKRLVIIGYSFAPTDYNVKKLLLDAFQENTPEELIVVNPDDNIKKIAKELTHFSKPVLAYDCLEDYLKSLPKELAALPPDTSTIVHVQD